MAEENTTQTPPEGETNPPATEGDQPTGAEGDDPSKEGQPEGDKPEGADESDYTDFELPEGVQVDNALLDKAKSIFKELGLTQEQAQKFVNLQAAAVANQVESFNQLKQNWLEQTQSDKDIGGDKLEQSVSDAKAALDKFGTPALKELLTEYGIGNHPEMVRLLAHVGRLTKEDSPGQSGGSPSEKKDRVSVLYPNT